MKGFWNFVSGLVVGAAVGAVVALIVAPDSGDGLRREIKREIDDIFSEGRRAAAQRRAELEEQLEQLRRDGG